MRKLNCALFFPPGSHWTAWLGLLNEMELDLTLTIALMRVFAQPEGVPEDAMGCYSDGARLWPEALPELRSELVTFFNFIVVTVLFAASIFGNFKIVTDSQLGWPRAAVPAQSLGSSLRGGVWRSSRCEPGFCSPTAWA